MLINFDVIFGLSAGKVCLPNTRGLARVGILKIANQKNIDFNN
jgi:hypothetical protein